MKRVHIVGRKNAGKTTLIEELVRRMVASGVRVGTIKHTHHRHELDTPGKDSHRHRLAGAAAVGILSPHLNAVFWPPDPAGAGDRYASLGSMMDDCDLVLVEGDSQTDGLKVEVWRKEVAERPLAATDRSFCAVISDDPVPDMVIPVWPRRNLELLVDRLRQLVEQG